MKKRLWLFLPPMAAHRLADLFLKFRGLFFKRQTFSWKSFSWRGLKFENPLGTAGGLDKSAENLEGWWSFGPGFVEIGTLTLDAQKANRGVILRRDIKSEALWNYMGFPNRGLMFALKKLRKIKKPFPTPVFISLAPQRASSLERGVKDISLMIQKLSVFADAFVLNMSSPNTPGLRDLFDKASFKKFLHPISKESLMKKTPLLLKMSPDLSDEDFLRVAESSLSEGVSGFVVCNSTLKRGGEAPPQMRRGSQSSKVLPQTPMHNSPPLSHDWEKGGLGGERADKKHGEALPPFPSRGGVSGRPLAERSFYLLKLLLDFLGERRKDLLIVSSGGVMSPEDAAERLSAGADLVQVYTALTFFGPGFFSHTNSFFQPHPPTRP